MDNKTSIKDKQILIVRYQNSILIKLFRIFCSEECQIISKALVWVGIVNNLNIYQMKTVHPMWHYKEPKKVASIQIKYKEGNIKYQ